MTFQYLDDNALQEVQDAAVDLGFANDSDLRALTANISPAFVATALQGGNELAKLISLTNRMNQTRVLLSGEIPLGKWLRTAVQLAAGREQGLVFRRALEMLAIDGRATPDASITDTSPIPADVQALPTKDGALEAVIGQDDTLDVGFLHQGAAAARSVAKLLVHRHFDGNPMFLSGNAPEVGSGTGWLIAPSLLITNHHVIAARRSDEPAVTEADFTKQGTATEVQFEFYQQDSDVRRVQSLGCVASDRALDFAILRLPDAEPARVPLRLRMNPLIKPAGNPLHERVNVLQHPGGNPMRIGFRNNFVVSGDAARLSYLTDTAGGSSGSPICDDSWFVAALHRGFQTISGKEIELWGKSINQENYGTPIGQILAYLAANHSALYAEVVNGQHAF